MLTEFKHFFQLPTAVILVNSAAIIPIQTGSVFAGVRATDVLLFCRDYSYPSKINPHKNIYNIYNLDMISLSASTDYSIFNKKYI